MRYLSLRRFPAFAAAILAFGLLPGCGGDHDDDNYYYGDPYDENLPPSVEILSVIIDSEKREIVARVAVIDDGESGAAGVDLSFVVFGGGAYRIVDVLDSSSGRDRLGNQLIGVLFDDDYPGAVTEVRLSTITPNPLYSDSRAALEVEVTDGVWFESAARDFDLRLSSEPVCILRSPGTSQQAGGLVPVRIELGDLDGDAADITLWYSFDGGATLHGATLASTSDGMLGPVVPCDTSNPAGDGVIGIPTAVGGALVTFTVHWDSVQDGVGLGTVAVVDLFVFAQDCVDRPALSAPPGAQYDVLIFNP